MDSTTNGGGLNRQKSMTARKSMANLLARPSTVGQMRRPTSVAAMRDGVTSPTSPTEQETGEPQIESQATIEKDRNLSMWDAAPWREKLYAVAEPGSFPSDVPGSIEIASYIYAVAMVSIIIVSSVSIMVASYPRFQMEPIPIFWIAVEAVCVAVFTLDIMLRLVTIPVRSEFFTDGMNYIDLAAVLPFYIQLFFNTTFFQWFRMLRILRLMRIIRVLRTTNALGFVAIMDALTHSLSELLLFLIISGTCLLILSTAFFFVERGIFDRTDNTWKRRCFKYENCVNGREPSPVQSIPDAFWYTITSLSTVGFGDVYPKTGVGQLVGTATMICGVFIMGFPTMILSGHYEAVEKMEVKMFSAWTRFLEMRGRLEKPGDALKRRMGWVRPASSSQGQGLARTSSALVPPALGKSVSSKKLQKSISSKSLTAGSDGMHTPGSEGTGTHGNLLTPISAPTEYTVGFFTWGGRIRELKRRVVNPHAYYYEPLFALQRTMEGCPDVRVVFGKCGMPNMVHLTLILDHADARSEAVRLLNTIDQNGTIECDVGGGFSVRHYTPTGKLGTYVQLPTKANDNYRNSDFPVYFMRDEDHDGEVDEVDYLDEDQMVEEAKADLLGTSLFIQSHLEESTARFRITLVQQLFQETRLQRELELIALTADDGMDRMAYIGPHDARLLLEGIHTKVDLQDPSLMFEDPEAVDETIADALMARLRTVKYHTIPPRYRQCIYNGDLLRQDQPLYEVPMSMFYSDEADEVEIDSLGYAEVRVLPILSHSLRLDIRMDSTVQIAPSAASFALNDW